MQSAINRSSNSVNPQEFIGDPSGFPSRTTSLVGTIDYMAPEVVILFGRKILHRGGYTRSVDFWSLGIMIYKLLTNLEPFVASTEILKTFFAQHLTRFACYRDGFDSFFGVIDYTICNGILNETTCNLLQGLLEFNGDNRLGYDANDVQAGFAKLMNHAFFNTIDWTLLESKQLPPPYIPHDEVISTLQSAEVVPKTLNELLVDSSLPHWSLEDSYSDSVTSRNRLNISTKDQQYFKTWYYERLIM